MTETNLCVMLCLEVNTMEVKILMEENLYKSLQMALQINNETLEAVADSIFRNYISKTFSKAATAIESGNAKNQVQNEDINYGKAMYRIPKWAKKHNQINHKIIKAFLKLAQNGAVAYEDLLRECSNPDSDVYVPTFSSNFAQMKFDGDKSHGKVFVVDNSNIVTIWEYVEDTILQYKEDFLGIKSTDTGYINKNNQLNTGKTELDGTDHMQKLYNMRCLEDGCGYEYFANGTDIFQKKCPKCQGGTDTGMK